MNEVVRVSKCDWENPGRRVIEGEIFCATWSLERRMGALLFDYGIYTHRFALPSVIQTEVTLDSDGPWERDVLVGLGQEPSCRKHITIYDPSKFSSDRLVITENPVIPVSFFDSPQLDHFRLYFRNVIDPYSTKLPLAYYFMSDTLNRLNQMLDSLTQKLSVNTAA